MMTPSCHLLRPKFDCRVHKWNQLPRSTKHLSLHMPEERKYIIIIIIIITIYQHAFLRKSQKHGQQRLTPSTKVTQEFTSWFWINKFSVSSGMSSDSCFCHKFWRKTVPCRRTGNRKCPRTNGYSVRRWNEQISRCGRTEKISLLSYHTIPAWLTGSESYVVPFHLLFVHSYVPLFFKKSFFRVLPIPCLQPLCEPWSRFNKILQHVRDHFYCLPSRPWPNWPIGIFEKTLNDYTSKSFSSAHQISWFI